MLPGIHPAVDDWVVHGIGHGQPVDAQVQLLDVGRDVDLLHVPRDDEINVERQPTHGEDGHHHDHHLHHLSIKVYLNGNVASSQMALTSKHFR